MADQVEVSKSVAHVLTGPDGDEASAAKVVAYMILVPGEIVDDSTRQGHIHTQILQRS